MGILLKPCAKEKLTLYFVTAILRRPMGQGSHHYEYITIMLLSPAATPGTLTVTSGLAPCAAEGLRAGTACVMVLP